MADSASTIIIRANALRALKETGPQIAAQLGIEPPKLDFFYKDHDYQQAQELTALAEFNTRLLDALKNQSQGEDDGVSSSPPLPKREQHRTVASQRRTG
jgi:hypothetical protein